jgi:hypothetical protein
MTTPIARCQRPRQSGLVIVHIATFVLLCSGVFGQQIAAEKMRLSFVVVSGATNVTHYDLPGGRKELSYRVQADYPAQSVLNTIKRKLKDRGWLPLSEDYLNPGLPSSLVRGWDYYEDRTTKPWTSVRVWQTDWRRQHELVTYRLEYRCPDNRCASTYNLRDLQIYAIYDPRPDEVN